MGIGNHIQFFNLPGGIVAVNPDSGNRVIFVAADGKTTRTIYRDIDPASRLQVLNKVAVDSSAMEIYIYSPRERRILVYDTAGNYKGNIAIQRVHDGSFTRIHGKFLFLDKTDSTKKDAARVYVVDSTGGEVNGL